tara:strand:+ start:16 stop:738 length:723 start_codon:yes stop_codon:yes gene_type:complete
MSKIANVDNSISAKLRNGLGDIVGNREDYLKVLVDMVYIDQDYYESNNDTFEDMDEFLKEKYSKIEQKCIEPNKCFKCICGQQHLKELNIMSHNSKKYILGSDCITRFEDLMIIDLDKDKLKLTVEEWRKLQDSIKYWMEISKRKSNERKSTKKHCVSCKQKKITNHKFTDARREYWCSDCINTHKTRCLDCEEFFWNFKKNCVNKYGKIWKWRCHPCYQINEEKKKQTRIAKRKRPIEG